jgi:tellurite resistance protein
VGGDMAVISGETGGKLAEMIKKAIEDGKLTNSEYEQILALAEADGVIDRQEKRLLTQLQEMLTNKSVVRVPD